MVGDLAGNVDLLLLARMNSENLMSAFCSHCHLWLLHGDNGPEDGWFVETRCEV